MKGLLLKEYHSLFTTVCFYIAVLSVFSLFVICTDGPAMCAYVPVLFGLLASTRLTADEQCRWNRYALTLPCSRGQYVSVKYVVVLLLVALGEALVCTILLATGTAKTLGAEKMLALTALSGSIALLLPAFKMPLVFLFDAVHARVISFLFIILGTIGVTGFSMIMLTSDGTTGTTVADMIQYLITHPLSVLGVCLLLFAASWLLSVLIHRKKDI